MGSLLPPKLIEGHTIRTVATTATRTEGANNVLSQRNSVNGYRLHSIKITILQGHETDMLTISNGVIKNNTLQSAVGTTPPSPYG
ncbi:hypothetical protein DAETH_33480 (plasmid) [Deinococcus aetherius]|uniref:Uncharacterized protein n=2 Tax=Deinococcus aetherius TaxID=200252 RepID=A0ABN6RNE0_9DEIO|nr:hypothetical protein DAETH_33480 [Deinococcus aetherius]